MQVEVVLLGGYAAKSCARKTHNAYDRLLPKMPERVPEPLQRLFEMGRAHEASVYARWSTADPNVVDLSPLDNHPGHVEETVREMRAGRAVILGGRLPDDPAGGRTGKPDVLLQEKHGSGYHPCDVKAHKVLDRARKNGLVSTVEAPALADAVVRPAGLKPDIRDLMQLAHYWRMLEVCGSQAEEPWGAVVGTDDPDRPVLAWFDLTERRFVTYSESAKGNKAKRSSLERYDHEHGFRIKVARVAQQRLGSPDDPEPLVQPLGQEECLACRWAPVCVETLPADDATLHLRDALSVREYLALRRQGVQTLSELADADVDAILKTAYERETVDQTHRIARLYKAHMSAVLARDGVMMRVKDDPQFDVPSAAVEIDLDMESAPDGTVYLWGALVTSAGASKYEPFGAPSVADPAAELTVLRQCLDWLVVSRPEAVVFHYAHVERAKAVRILGALQAEYSGTVSDPNRWVDMLPATKRCLDSRKGHGLKAVATYGAGFAWRDESPGGLESQVWLEAARSGDRTAWTRILDYNEDDVKATLAVRQWLRREATAQQPGLV